MSMLRQNRSIKVSVTTGYYFANGKIESRYKEGEPISGVVWMTNMGDAPVCVCSSVSLYQDKPQLFKDGKEVPYFRERQEWEERSWDSDEPCNEVIRPFEIFKLEPHVRTIVDYFVISEGKQKTGNIKWYDTLGTGHYRLSLTRKFNCCAGPEAKSEPFDFEIVEDDYIFSNSVNRMSRLTASARKAFDIAWLTLQRDFDFPEKELEAYSVELREDNDSYFFYFHSRQRERFFAECSDGNSSACQKAGSIGRDAGYWVRKSDFAIPMSVK